VPVAFPVCDARLRCNPHPRDLFSRCYALSGSQWFYCFGFYSRLYGRTDLMEFADAVHEQPRLHTEYLLHHPWLPSDYFAGALLLKDLWRVERLPFFLHVYHALEACFYWGSPGKCVLFCISYIIMCYPRFARTFNLKLQVSMSGKRRSPDLNSFVSTLLAPLGFTLRIPKRLFGFCLTKCLSGPKLFLYW
jgi:hypothetical protein